MCTVCSLDVTTTEEFGERLVGTLNAGATALMISIGHRTGLFDTMGSLEASTSPEIAKAAGLDERYVREWLGAMTTARIVLCDPEGPRYLLPAEHAAMLTRKAGADNFGVLLQYIGVLASVEDRIVDCFKAGGGVPYLEFPRFHEVMAEESGQTVLSTLLDKILPLADGIQSRMNEGIRVLDVGCGSGHALNLMARTYRASSFAGYDLSSQALATARAVAAEHASENASFEERDLSTFESDASPESFDLVTAFDSIHDQARPDALLAGIFRTLKPGGVFLMQDIDMRTAHHENIEHPIGPMLYTISTMHCMTVSLAQGGMGLGAAWGNEKALEMLADAGFRDVRIERLDHDFQNCYYICRK